MKRKYLKIQKIIIVYGIIWSICFSIVYAIQPGGNSNIENKMENIINEISDFDILIYGTLDLNFKDVSYDEIMQTLYNKSPKKSGVWISKESREIFLELINSRTNNEFEIDKDGFLVVKENEKKQLSNTEYLEDNNYIEKIKEIINGNRCIIIDVNNNYKKRNNNNIINVSMDNEEILEFKNPNSTDLISKVIIINKNYFDLENKEKEELIKRIVDNENCDKEKTKRNVLDEKPIKEEILDEFDTVLAGIKTKSIEKSNQLDISNMKDNLKGIWIDEESRKTVLDFINIHSSYTYSIDDNGYLVSDNVIKKNEYLDFSDLTEMDLEIQYIISKNIKVYISVDDKYLVYKENEVSFNYLSEKEYMKTFDNSELTERIVILNSRYFNNKEFNIELSDIFIKNILKYDEESDIEANSVLSDTSKYGYMTESRSVYFGPNSTDYASVGSVDYNEKVYLLGQSAGWYHIQYLVGNTGKQKSGFVPVDTVTNVVANSPVHEEVLTGGYRYANNQITIYSCDNLEIALSVGTVFAGEGITLIYSYNYSDSSKSYDIAYIEYSTSSGTKRGYIYSSNLVVAEYVTSVARIVSTSSAYSGPDTSYVKLGGGYYNEYVAIIAKEENWVFVEYNTKAGRKRGFMKYSNLSNCNYPNGGYADFKRIIGLKKAQKQINVYGGPNSNYARIGTIFNQEIVSYLSTEREYAYIEYNTNSGAKRGYVIANELITTEAPQLPNTNTYAGFTRGTYGTSGLGKDLIYYKIGNGDNVCFTVFEQHGWEDAWAYDGTELVKIADRVMSNLSSSGINNNWTLYIIPYANPDGITNGYTNNGPGRCTVSKQIDMNRSWPANFTPYYSSRNFTGETALGSVEVLSLYNFINNNIGSGKKIILDIHGWLNMTYGNQEIGQYFGEQFGFGHSSTYGNGYLETWGQLIGAKSCLVELPMPVNSNDIDARNFSGKIATAIRNMLNNEIDENEQGGIEVNENVIVISEGNLNVRSGPGTSYTAIATVANGTIITRIRKSVGTANGYTWDKIRLSNGTEGYVASNYLAIPAASEYIIDGKKFVKDKTSSEHDTEYIEKKQQEDSNWNTMSSADRAIKNSKMNSTYNRLNQAAEDYKSTFELGSQALKYYLSCEGGIQKLGDIRTLFIIEGQALIEYDYLDRCIKAAEYFTETTSAASFALDYEYDLVVGDYSTISAEFIAATVNNDLYSQIRVDWFLAAHAFKMGNYATVEKNGDIYSMYVNFNMCDYYDWDNSSNIFPLDTDLLNPIRESDIRDLHYAGKSKNYENKGTIRILVEWQKGQNARQGNVSILG